MDWRVDASNGITVIQWYDKGVVQLASTYIGHEHGNKAKRWTAKENKRIEIECLAMVDQYNARMEGVDLCDICCLPCIEFD